MQAAQGTAGIDLVMLLGSALVFEDPTVVTSPLGDGATVWATLAFLAAGAAVRPAPGTSKA